MTRYYINMNDGRVIAGTEETKDNICYREIDISWALAIRDGKVKPNEVISMVNSKVGMVPYSEWTKGIEKLNVRSRDLHMAEHARGETEAEKKDEGKPNGVLGAFKPEPKPAKEPAKEPAKAPANKVVVNV